LIPFDDRAVARELIQLLKLAETEGGARSGVID